MTAEAAQNLDEILGPETTEEVAEETTEVVEQVAEPTEPVAEQPKQSDPDEIVRSYKAMAHQERMERKQLQEQMAVMQQRFEQIFQASQKQPEPAPEYDDDPLGATHAKVDKALQSVQELRQMEVARQQQAQFTGYIENVKAAENAFMQKNPDYKDAVTYVQSRRVNELRTMGYDEQAAMQVLAQDAFALSQRAQQLGQSPAELIYNLAKQTGYAAKASQPSNIDTIAAGQQVARSVSGGANPVTEGGLPPNLAELSDSDFEALFKKMVK